MNIASKNNSEHYNWGESCEGWHLLKSEGFSIIEELVPPGSKEQRHYHNSAQQFFYVLSGEANLEVSGVKHLLRTGQGFHVSPKEPHQLSNTSSEALEFLVISQPMSHGDRVDA